MQIQAAVNAKAKERAQKKAAQSRTTGGVTDSDSDVDYSDYDSEEDSDS
jgi:hypothetical protein